MTLPFCEMRIAYTEIRGYIPKMRPLAGIALLAIVAGPVCSAWAQVTASTAFLNGDALKEPKAAVDVQNCAGRADEDGFRERALKTGRDLGLTDDEAARAAKLYVARCASSERRRDANSKSGAVYDPKKSKDISGKAVQIAAVLNEQRGVESASGGTVIAGGASGIGAPIDYRALNAVPAVQPYTTSKTRIAVPYVVFNDLGDAQAAPAPTLIERAQSLVTPSAATVAEDLKTLQARLTDFQLPPGAQGLASSNAPLDEFVQWAKTVSPSALPDISYGVLPEGKIGEYFPGIFGRGTIKLNYYILDKPADERSAVLFHEMYHYWDKKVAGLNYGNVSYGYIDPAHKPEHEYDAYYLTALYWQKIKTGSVDDALARCLDRYPTDPEQVRTTVDKIVGEKQ